MGQFEDNLIINGIDVRRKFNICCYSIKQKEENIVGINRKVNFENGVFSGVIDENINEILVEFVKVNYLGDSLPFSKDDIKELMRILYKNPICTLIHNNKIYYGSFSVGDLMLFSNDYGYISIPFNSCSPYCYSLIKKDKYRVIGEKEIYLNNESNVKDVYIDMVITQNGNESITISNLDDYNTKMIFNGIDNGEKIKVLGCDVREIVSISSPNHNVFNLCEYEDFIKLKYGENRIKVIGNCSIEFIWQEPIIIE